MGPPESGTPDRLVLELGRLGSAPLPLVGGKALNLGRLANAGFPVPAGFCLTTAAYRMAVPSELEALAARLDSLPSRARRPGSRGSTRRRGAGQRESIRQRAPAGGCTAGKCPAGNCPARDCAACTGARRERRRSRPRWRLPSAGHTPPWATRPFPPAVHARLPGRPTTVRRPLLSARPPWRFGPPPGRGPALRELRRPTGFVPRVVGADAVVRQSGAAGPPSGRTVQSRTAPPTESAMATSASPSSSST